VHLPRVLDSYNAPRDSSDVPDALRSLIDKQWFTPVFWRTAGQTINYRRFFYLNDFISLRVEEPAVFDRVHQRMLELIGDGLVTGLRIDHIDGLHDPLAYLHRLREAAPDSYLVVEKILEMEETLPSLWPIEGTSGYKFCNYVNGIFCDCGSEPAMTDIYNEFIGAEADYATLLYEAKLRILTERMGGEVAYLAHLVKKALANDDDSSRDSWQHALAALIAAFPVYRTYIDARQFTDQDRAFITSAVLEAKKRAPDYQGQIDRMGELLLSYRPVAGPSGEQEAHRYVVMRLQQFTGPAMAKGLEDTLFYTYNRFITLNEVGGDPESFGVPLDRFHRFNEMRARHWPHAMNATSTHDAKRGEDVRARLNVLSEMPDRWRETVARWSQLNAAHKQPCGDLTVPDANDEYLLYQTMVGALPFREREFDDFNNRLKEFMLKALREAKRHTTWTEPNECYENGCMAFLDRILDRGPHNAFWTDVLTFQKDIAAYGIYNSLSQTALKIMCPGLPDFYQGADLWDLNLVDPDNRRPVDFVERKAALDAFADLSLNAHGEEVRRLLADKADGRVKLFVIDKLLHLRGANRLFFDTADYLPVDVFGRWARHVVAFLRTDGDACVLVVVPRFLTPLVQPGVLPIGRGIWEDTHLRLPGDGSGSWHNALTGEPLEVETDVHVGDALSEFPIGVFLNEPLMARHG
jgi:(1->4)-alpha-D-glucan 1-alpha-D-glucosylmutase